MTTFVKDDERAKEDGDASFRHGTPTPRGAFLLLEGMDNSGKTTQCGLLLKHLVSLGMAAVAMRFPDRTTPIGVLLDSYLKGSGGGGSNNDNDAAANSKNNNNNTTTAVVDDRVVHLLFSSNRWESCAVLAQHLADGTTVVCDRYAYSGVAFSSAKEPPLDLEWCRSCDVGLPAPDAILFLDVSQEEAAQRRGGYGEERYEKREMQMRVRQQFSKLQKMDEDEKGGGGGSQWHVVNASASVSEVQEEIKKIALETVQRVANAPLQKLWTTSPSPYPLPPPSTETRSDSC